MTDTVALVGAKALAYVATTIDPGTAQPPGTDGLLTMLGWAKWIGVFCAVVGLILVGIEMMLRHREGGRADSGSHLMRVGGGMVLVGASSAIVGAVL